MPIAWDPSYSVNVKIIDEQHKIFIGLLGEACECAYQPKDRAKLEKIMERLLKYADTHFKTEEGYFEQFHYENAEEHIKEHLKLREKMKKFHHDFSEEKKDVAAEFIDFLEDWLVDHLDCQDKKYTKCFNDHGLY